MIFSNLVLNMRADCCFHCFRNFIFRMKYSNRPRSFCYLSASRMKERVIQQPSVFVKVHVIGAQPRISSSHGLHTVKGWKFVVKPELTENDDDAEFDPADAPCEEGTGAVPHNQLVSQLNECSTVEDQIYMLNSTLRLTNEDIANRKAFCNSIAEALVPYLSDFKVHQFGSGINGLGFKGCDIDLCIQTAFDNTAGDEYIKLEVPSLEEVLEGKFLKSDVIRLYPRYFLRFIRRILRKHCADIRVPIFLVKARCPILRFYDQKHDLFCDFSCENKSALRNTKLLLLLSRLDDRVGLLGKVLRYWGKHGKFVGDIDMFNSYAFTLLIIYFLQNTTPAVLPPLDDIFTKTDYVLYGDIQDEELLLKSLKMIPPTKNTQTTDELLREFFFFYLYYDFGRVMLPLTSYSVNKQDFKSDENPPTDTFDFSTVCLQDPFRQSFNATSGVAFKYCREFLTRIVDACKLYEDPNVWLQNRENWGLSSLFASTPVEGVKDKIEVNKIEAFEVSIKLAAVNLSETCEDTVSATERYHQNISKCLKKVLEHCLLFQCTPLFLTHKSKYHEQQILKLLCKVTHNTWTGRHLAHREHFSNSSADNPIELEHQISTYLAKEKKSGEVLFKSVCNCYVMEKDGHTVLKLCFVLESGKISPIVKIFFDEYIPKMLNYLL